MWQSLIMCLFKLYGNQHVLLGKMKDVDLAVSPTGSLEYEVCGCINCINY